MSQTCADFLDGIAAIAHESRAGKIRALGFGVNDFANLLSKPDVYDFLVFDSPPGEGWCGLRLKGIPLQLLPLLPVCKIYFEDTYDLEFDEVLYSLPVKPPEFLFTCPLLQSA